MPEMSQREAYGRALVEYGEINPRVVVVDADTSVSNFTHLFANRFPERFFNTGIAEPCTVNTGVGLALAGFIPFVNVFATLLALRSLEQIRTNVCYAHTNVKLAAHYAGLSDFKDGPTHYSISDIANLRALPDMTVIVPADANEVARWVPLIAEMEGPVYFRLNRSATLPVHPKDVKVVIGKGMTLLSGNDLTLITTGAMTGRVLKAAAELEKKGIHARVLEIPCIKPLDTDLICQAAAETHKLVTIEEHSIVGGLGGAVAETISEHYPTQLIRVGIHDAFTRTGLDPESLLGLCGLGVADIILASEKILKGS
jgi:transketolase